MDIYDAIKFAIDGKAILFAGAGFSYGARTLEGASFPSGKAFSYELLTEIGYSKPDGALDKAASAYLRRKSPRDFVELLKKRFSVRDITPSHEVLASIPWRRVYTTNYDTVFEEARRKVSMPFTTVEASDSPKDFISNQGLIVHINGVITRLTEDSLNSNFKLITQSYAADSFEQSGWAFHFRNDVRAASAIIFVGYSMYDIDVRRILFDEDISEKCFFVIAPITPDNELDAEDLADLGIILPVGIDEFANTVTDVKAEYTPSEPELLLQDWEEVQHITGAATLPTDHEVLDFLTEGRLSEGLLFESVGPSKGQYIVERESFSTLDDALSNFGKYVLLIGDLGTGKSFLFDGVAQLFLTRGHSVFKLESPLENEISEVEEICSIPGDKLLIIENYQRHLKLLKWLSDVNPQNISVALTVRSNVHDLFADELFEILGERLQVLDIERLTKKEIDSTVSLFNLYGLWASRSSWGAERKQSFIARDCNGYLPSILVDILKSRHITDRYKQLLAEVSNRSDVETFLICAFTLDLLEFPVKLEYIQELLGNRVKWGLLRAKPELKTIVDFKSNTVVAKSSVLAKHLLHGIFSAKKVTDTLIGMAKEAENRKDTLVYWEILNALMRYRSIASVLPENNRLASTINFYEGIKNLNAAKRNPQFWLQYAIACLAFNQLERAERYFKDAYSFAYEGYNTFQIDNHYARLQLEKALEAKSIGDAILLVEEARKIVFAQMGAEYRFYPYRVSLGFFKCFERFSTEWTVEQKSYFIRIFKELKRRCEATRGNLRKNKYVIECLSKADQMLE